MKFCCRVSFCFSLLTCDVQSFWRYRVIRSDRERDYCIEFSTKSRIFKLLCFIYNWTITSLKLNCKNCHQASSWSIAESIHKCMISPRISGTMSVFWIKKCNIHSKSYLKTVLKSYSDLKCGPFNMFSPSKTEHSPSNFCLRCGASFPHSATQAPHTEEMCGGSAFAMQPEVWSKGVSSPCVLHSAATLWGNNRQ